MRSPWIFDHSIASEAFEKSNTAMTQMPQESQSERKADRRMCRSHARSISDVPSTSRSSQGS